MKRQRYHCTVDYMTKGGSPGSVGYIIRANDIETAASEARDKALRDRRRNVVKINGGATTLIKD